MTRHTYATPAAFKRALEDRLKATSETGVDFARRRQLLVFDRFLARTAVAFGDAVLLKGGLVLELRLERARTTKDIDIRLAGSIVDLLPRLQAAGRLDLDDFMSFEVLPDPDTPQIVGDGVEYDGYRFRAECRLAGKVYGARFGVDIAVGGPVTGDVEEVVADDLLAFAGVAPPKLRVVPIETHIAEKLHAYTLPRERPNTRVKDLPDLALLGTIRSLDAERVRAAIDRTFSSRHVQPVPATLPPPPQAWEEPYVRMAELDDLTWRTLAEVEAAARAFLDPTGPSAPTRPMYSSFIVGWTRWVSAHAMNCRAQDSHCSSVANFSSPRALGTSCLYSAQRASHFLAYSATRRSGSSAARSTRSPRPGPATG